MYDNLSFKLPTEGLHKRTLEGFEQSLQYLNTSYRTEENQTRYYQSRKYKYSVSFTDRYIRFYKFSAPTFLYGTNEIQFQFGEIYQVISKLIDETKLPIDQAEVTRIDVAGNLEVEKPPTEYFEVLGKNSRFKMRLPYPNSLNYQQKSNRRRLIFYDKLAERIDKGYQLVNPENKTLRYEMKLIKSPHKALKTPPMKFIDLTSKSHQTALLKLWKKEYEMINKVGEAESLSNVKIHTPKDLFDYAAFLQLNNQNTLDHTYKQINNWKESGTISQKFIENFNNKLKELQYKYRPTLTDRKSSKVEELNSLVMKQFGLLMGDANSEPFF